jgi:2-keto-4-pentenoate hydratase/2-oxohepta-3-ene-1,7-dioic acid hydratase in catechol pathway
MDLGPEGRTGGIISTGTPAAVRVRPGDAVGCRIEGIGTLPNPVVGQADVPDGAA